MTNENVSLVNIKS